MLFVRPSCGLCNRLRVVISSLVLSEKIILLWRQTGDCNCFLSDLFEPHSKIRVLPFWLAERIGPFGRVITPAKLTELRYRLGLEGITYLDGLYHDFIPLGMTAQDYEGRVRALLGTLIPAEPVAKVGGSDGFAVRTSTQT